MKKINIRFLLSLTLISALTSCLDQDFKDGKIQSVDNQGSSGRIISTAVTATSNSEFYANAVVPSSSEAEFAMIPVVLNSKDVASKDIHVKMVPDPEALAEYNSHTFDTQNPTTGVITPHPELYYVMPGAAGTPAFTLVDDGLVTIPKGSSVGYLKIRTTSANYFGSTQYAFSYKIESVQEAGYVISGNHYFGIVALIPKNPYDGVYNYGAPGSVERFTGCCAPLNDALAGNYPGSFKRNLVTTGLNSIALSPVWVDGSAVGGIDGTYFTVDPVAQPNGKHLVTMACATNNTLVNIPGEDNYYDPATKTFKLAFTWGAVNKRNIRATLVYHGSR